MLPKELRAKILYMRRKGSSFPEITAETGIQRSTLSYLLQGIALSPKQYSDRRKALGIRLNSNLTPRQRHRNGSKGGKQCQLSHGKQIRKNLKEGRFCSGLLYREDELPFLRKLNTLYRSVFKKEHIGSRFVDFADEYYLIEVSSDSTKGISDIISRFKEVSRFDTKRKRVAYVRTDRLGPKRLFRLETLNVEVLDIKLLV